MNERVELIIDGLPKPQPRARAQVVHRGKRVFPHMYTPDSPDLKTWRASVVWAWQCAAVIQPWCFPVVMHATLYVPRLKKMTTPHAVPCITRMFGDWDNLGKAISDALTDANAWTDDAVIYDARITKYHHAEGGSPGARIVLVHETPAARQLTLEHA